MTGPSKTILIIGAGEFISSEDSNYRSREPMTLAITTVALEAGTVLGRTRGAQTVTGPTARAGNSAGNGAFTAVSVGAAQAAGGYGIFFTSATAGVVEDASGKEIGTFASGVAFSHGGINFTFTAGGTAQVAGDAFDLTVSYAGGGQYKPLDPAATDGSAVFAGILYERRPISTGTQRAVALVRAMSYNANKVVYVNALSGPQLTAMEAQAVAAGCIPRY